MTDLAAKTLEIFTAYSSLHSPQREVVIEEVASALVWMLLRCGNISEDKTSGDLGYTALHAPPLCDLLGSVTSSKLMAHMCARLQNIAAQADPDPKENISSLEAASSLCQLVRLLLELPGAIASCTSTTATVPPEVAAAAQFFSTEAFAHVLANLLQLEVQLLLCYRSGKKAPRQRSIRRIRILLRIVSLVAGSWGDAVALENLDKVLLAKFQCSSGNSPGVFSDPSPSPSPCSSAIAVEEFRDLSQELKSSSASLLPNLRRYIEFGAADPTARLAELQRRLLREEVG